MLNAPDQSYLVKLIDNYNGAISFTGSLLVLQCDCTGIDCFISIIPVHDKSTMGGRTQGSKATKPRKRSKKTDFQKKKDAENRAKKKAQQESIECARNLASFRASLLAGGQRTSSTVDSIVPPIPDPLPDAVEIQGIPHWTEQLNPGEITAQLDAENDEGKEEDADDAKNFNLPADSVMNIYLQAIQSRVKYEVKETTPTGEKWLHKHLEEND
jgi:hypothetical protein